MKKKGKKTREKKEGGEGGGWGVGHMLAVDRKMEKNVRYASANQTEIIAEGSRSVWSEYVLSRADGLFYFGGHE